MFLLPVNTATKHVLIYSLTPRKQTIQSYHVQSFVIYSFNEHILDDWRMAVSLTVQVLFP